MCCGSNRRTFAISGRGNIAVWFPDRGWVALRTATISCNVCRLLSAFILMLPSPRKWKLSLRLHDKNQKSQWPRRTLNNDFTEAPNFSAYITRSRHRDPSPWNRTKSFSVEGVSSSCNAPGVLFHFKVRGGPLLLCELLSRHPSLRTF
jgi:hypothetical protein